MHLGNSNQSIEKTLSFRVGVAYTCIKDAFALMIKLVNVISMIITFFSFCRCGRQPFQDYHKVTNTCPSALLR